MLSSHCPRQPTLQSFQFSSLQLNSLNIRIIDKLRPTFYFLSELYLDNNMLASLNGIQQFQNLEVLSFNFNHVELFGELYKVSNKFFMKQLSFIGNPLEWDLRAKYDYITVNIFVNLESLNPVQRCRAKLKFKTFKQRIKKYRTKSQSVDQNEIDGKTQRIHPNMIYNESEYTKRGEIKSQYEENKKFERSSPEINRFNDTYVKVRIKDLQMSENKLRTDRFSQQNVHSKSSVMNRSTSGNSYARSYEGGRLYCKRNNDSQAKSGNRHKQIAIQPFQYMEEPRESYQQQEQQRSEEERGLQQQSSIDENQSTQRQHIFGGTGHFYVDNNQTDQNKIWNTREHKSIAKRFLNEQKNEIARAFRMRHLKQKIFQILSLLKQKRNQQQQQLKRKAWAVIKMVNTLQKIQNQNKG